MKTKLTETENLNGERTWIVGILAGSCDFPSKREARKIKAAIDELIKSFRPAG